MQQIFDFFSFAGKEVATFIISMLPIVELRGAIPFAAVSGIVWWKAFLIAVAGNILPAPFILLLGRRIIGWLKKVKFLSKIATKYEAKLIEKAGKIQQYVFWGLFLVVAIPLPGTGAWSGSVVAAILEMPFKKALLAIVLGVLVSGIVVTLGVYGIVGAFSAIVK